MLMTRETLLRAGYTPERKEVKIYDSLPGRTAGERLAAILPLVPASWDLLYLGGGYQAPPLSRVNKYLIRNGGMLTTHAYAITSKMAKMVTGHLDAGYGVGLSTSGGLPGSRHDEVSPLPSSSAVPDSRASHPASAALVRYSPRGPPATFPIA